MFNTLKEVKDERGIATIEPLIAKQRRASILQLFKVTRLTPKEEMALRRKFGIHDGEQYGFEENLDEIAASFPRTQKKRTKRKIDENESTERTTVSTQSIQQLQAKAGKKILKVLPFYPELVEEIRAGFGLKLEKY